MKRFSAFCIASLIALPVCAEPSANGAPTPDSALTPDSAPTPNAGRPTAGPPQSDAAATAGARAAFEAAVQAYDARDYERAALGFAKAYSLKPHPDVLLNLAQSERLAKRPAAAANHFAQYLDGADTTGKDAATAQKALDDLRPQLVELTVGGMAGAALLINGERAGTLPLPRSIFVIPGRTLLQADGQEKSVEYIAGQTSTVTFQPPRPTAAPAVTTPLAVAAPAVHTQDQGTRKSFGSWFVDTPIAWAGAGVTAASLVTSIIAAETASRRFDAADDARGQIETQFALDGGTSGACVLPRLTAEYDNACRVFVDRRNAGDNWELASVATLLFGLVVAGTTVGYYYVDTDPSATDSAQTIITPVVTGEYQGIRLSGQF